MRGLLDGGHLFPFLHTALHERFSVGCGSLPGSEGQAPPSPPHTWLYSKQASPGLAPLHLLSNSAGRMPLWLHLKIHHVL